MSIDEADKIAVKRATEEFRAQLSNAHSGIEYIRRLAGPEAEEVHHVLYRYVELMRLSRPQLSFEEASLLIEALNGGRTLFFQPPNELKEYIIAEIEDWLEYYGNFNAPAASCSTLANKLRLLSTVELCSLVDSIDQWWKCDEQCVSAAGLAPYFNLTTERGMLCNG